MYIKHLQTYEKHIYIYIHIYSNTCVERFANAQTKAKA